MAKSQSVKTARTIASCLFAGGLMLAGAATGVALPQRAEAELEAPNFYQDGIGWIANSNDFLPPKSGLGPVTSDPAHPYIPNGGANGGPTFRVSDLSHPALMPWVKDTLNKLNDDVLAGKSLYTVANSCRPSGVPNMLLVRVTPFFFLQTPKEIWLIWQNDHMVRRIYMNQPHSSNVRPSWFGESVGHFEGDTLVVDTIGLNTKTTVDNYHTPHTDKLHVVERYRMVDDRKALEVGVTVDDPGAFTMPWSALQRYRRTDFGARRTEGQSTIAGDAAGYLYEEVCAESAISPVDIGMPPAPQATTPDF
jgi:hypothetical protein